jgi:hypothetical protein
MILTPEDRLMLAGARLAPTREDLDQLVHWSARVTDWDRFNRLAIRHGLGPMLHRNLDLAGPPIEMPEAVRRSLSTCYYQTLSRNVVLYEHFGRAAGALMTAGIPVIVLKGMFLADRLYGDIGLRQVSDIDILVRDRDLSPARRILTSIGYRQAKSFSNSGFMQLMSRKHLSQFLLNGVAIELHYDLKSNSTDCELNLAEFRDRAREFVVNGTRCYVLCPQDLLIHLCVHLSEHYTSDKFQLSRFVDIAEVINHEGHEMDWASFERACRRYRCMKEVSWIFNLLMKYFGTNIPDSFVLEPQAYAKEESAFLNHSSNEFRVPVYLYKNGQVPGASFRRFKGEHRFFRYLFPPLSFMKQRYGTRFGVVAFLYYFVRLKRGLIVFKGFRLKNLIYPR